MDEKVKRILERNIKSLDKNVQKAALLARNRVFLKELEGICERLGNTFFSVRQLWKQGIWSDSDGSTLLDLDYPKTKVYKGKVAGDRYFKGLIDLDRVSAGGKTTDERIHDKFSVLGNYVRQWEEFCDRWGIDPAWDACLSSLSGHMRERVYVDFEFARPSDRPLIKILVDEWTTIEDIRSQWWEVEKFQKELGKKESRVNFARDLCWYDLAKECNLKASEIARLWTEKFPDDIDLLVIRRLRSRIKEEDLKGKVLDDLDLLGEVRSGFLSAGHKAPFEEEKEYYVSGRIKRDDRTVKVNAPFVDVIKKAIKRMESQIRELDLPPVEPSVW